MAGINKINSSERMKGFPCNLPTVRIHTLKEHHQFLTKMEKLLIPDSMSEITDFNGFFNSNIRRV